MQPPALVASAGAQAAWRIASSRPGGKGDSNAASPSDSRTSATGFPHSAYQSSPSSGGAPRPCRHARAMVSTSGTIPPGTGPAAARVTMSARNIAE
jgi:hypothetical protein